MNPTEMQKQVDAQRWYHSIDFGNGVVAKGVSDTSHRVQSQKMPESYAGQRVLDIGCSDGFFAFDAEKKGAVEVVAIDWPNRSPAFDMAKDILDSKVIHRVMSVYDVSPESVGLFDAVLFVQVMYHLADHHRAIKAVASVCQNLCIIETLVEMSHPTIPMMTFHPQGQRCFHGGIQDYSVCYPNPACVESMFRDAGFKTVELVANYGDARMWAEGTQRRMVWHARK